MLKFSFNPKKSTQAAGVLLKLNNGDMDMYLFIKMLYLADRAALAKWQEPITGDEMVSMPYGPVPNTLYGLTKGHFKSLRSEWEKFISNAEEEANRVFLKGNPGTDELSRAEITILESVHSKFKNYTWKRMRDFCHNLPEYEDVGTSSKPLPVERILEALGKTASEIAAAEKSLRQTQLADLLLRR